MVIDIEIKQYALDRYRTSTSASTRPRAALYSTRRAFLRNFFRSPKSSPYNYEKFLVVLRNLGAPWLCNGTRLVVEEKVYSGDDCSRHADPQSVEAKCSRIKAIDTVSFLEFRPSPLPFDFSFNVKSLHFTKLFNVNTKQHKRFCIKLAPN